jgi:ubiquitin-protein ligase
VKGGDDEFVAKPFASKNDKDYQTWNVYIKGNRGTLYEGTVLRARLEFPDDYPMHPPKLIFVSKMFHPNIYADGKMCISTLHSPEDDFTLSENASEMWSPVNGISSVVMSVISLLNGPNDDSPANVDASKMRKEDRARYDRVVRDLAREESMKIDPREIE